LHSVFADDGGEMILSSLTLLSVKIPLRFPGSCLELASRLPFAETLPDALRKRGIRLRDWVGRSVELCDAEDTAADRDGEDDERGWETQSSERSSSQAFMVTALREAE